jgi:hypothetical protein
MYSCLQQTTRQYKSDPSLKHNEHQMLCTSDLHLKQVKPLPTQVTVNTILKNSASIFITGKTLALSTLDLMYKNQIIYLLHSTHANIR